MEALSTALGAAGAIFDTIKRVSYHSSTPYSSLLYIHSNLLLIPAAMKVLSWMRVNLPPFISKTSISVTQPDPMYR